jgi:hypothetical protein
LLDDLEGWSICLLITAVASLGKLGGSAAAARFAGMSWIESLQIGALMNTRGLMELIALNIGYDLGILSPRIFTMLVIMALVTTMLTGPLLTLFRRQKFGVVPEDGQESSRAGVSGSPAYGLRATNSGFERSRPVDADRVSLETRFDLDHARRLIE